MSVVELSVSSAHVVQSPSPYTSYKINVKLPMRALVVDRRYSEFVKLHQDLLEQTKQTPPRALPPKHLLANTNRNATLREERRQGLDAYLKEILSNANPQWRETVAWSSFLNLPTQANAARRALLAPNTISQDASDPETWLELHRQLTSLIDEVRRRVASRGRAEDITSSHEQSAAARASLIQAGSLLSTLERGLDRSRSKQGWGSAQIGEGEVRRRRDLVATARKEKTDLERLLVNLEQKRQIDETVNDKQALLQGSSPSNSHFSNSATSKPGKRRVLGKETARTQELDNRGVLDLQQQMMQEQDEDVEVLHAAVRRQKELAIQINEELAVQNEMLGLLDEDVSRLDGKVKVARKKVDNIK